jgi:hypothetical protein
LSGKRRKFSVETALKRNEYKKFLTIGVLTALTMTTFFVE